VCVWWGGGARGPAGEAKGGLVCVVSASRLDTASGSEVDGSGPRGQCRVVLVPHHTGRKSWQLQESSHRPWLVRPAGRGLADARALKRPAGPGRGRHAQPRRSYLVWRSWTGELVPSEETFSASGEHACPSFSSPLSPVFSRTPC